MTVEMMTKLLADAESYFGRPQTAENRASIAEIWANSSLKDVPDEMAYKTFHEVISKCSWQSQLLPAWKKAIEKAQGEQMLAKHCLAARTRMLKSKAERKLLGQENQNGGRKCLDTKSL